MLSLPSEFGFLANTEQCHAEKPFVHTRDDYSLTVSVIVTTYNISRLADRTLTGLLHQSYPNQLLEVIVSDDGSQDDVEGLVLKYARDFPSVVFLSQQHKGYRLATTRNRGIREATGEVVVCLDGDIIPSPRLLEEHLKWFHICERVATFGFLQYIDASRRAQLVPRS